MIVAFYLTSRSGTRHCGLSVDCFAVDVEDCRCFLFEFFFGIQPYHSLFVGTPQFLEYDLLLGLHILIEFGYTWKSLVEIVCRICGVTWSWRDTFSIYLIQINFLCWLFGVLRPKPADRLHPRGWCDDWFVGIRRAGPLVSTEQHFFG